MRLIAFPLTIDSIQLISEFTDGKINSQSRYSEFYRDFKERWLEECRLYEESEGDASLIHEITEQQITDRSGTLENLYNNKEELYSEWISKLRELPLQSCLLCSGPLPSQLDHFLPVSKYPHFSIFLKNLVPACDRCNRLKKTLVIENGLHLLHPYYCVLFEQKLINVEYEEPFSGFSFTLHIDRSLPLEIKRFVEFHFYKLEIDTKLKSHIESRISSFLVMKEERQRKGKRVDAIWALEWIEDSKNNTLSAFKTKNSWEYIFLESLESNQDFLSFLLFYQNLGTI